MIKNTSTTREFSYHVILFYVLANWAALHKHFEPMYNREFYKIEFWNQE